MSLFPDTAPRYYSDTDKVIHSQMEYSYRQAVMLNQTVWYEANVNNRFYAGDATLWGELYGNIPLTQRNKFSFNRIRRIVDMVSGYQRRNRKSTVVTGIENADDVCADQYTKIMMHINRNEHVLESISDAFQSALISGMSFLYAYMDYNEDPISGTVKVDFCPINSILVDPFFRKPDLSDCNYIWKRSFLTKRQLIAILPDYKEQILEIQSNDLRDGKFNYQPESFNFQGNNNLIPYDEYYYRDYRTQKMLCDAQTGETTEWEGEDNDDRLREYLNTYPQITLVTQEVPTVCVALVAGGRVLYNAGNPMGLDTYNFVPVFAYYSPEVPEYSLRVQGMVNGLRDAQFLYNMRKCIELDILQSQVNSGFIYKEDTLIDPKAVFMAGQGRGIALKKNAQMTDIQQIQSPVIPPTIIELSRILGEELSQISGVNEELLGSSSDDKAGILSMLRQGAGLTTLQGLFDRLDMSQKLLGDIELKLIQRNYTPGKVAKILGGEQPSDQFYNKAFGKYSCVVEEGINSSTQRQMNFVQLMELRAANIPIPDEALIEAAVLQDKKKLLDTIRAQNEARQKAEEAQQQAQLSQLQAQARLAESTAIANEGLGIERLSRVQENIASAQERKAEAVKDEDQAMLNLVKTLKELDSIDIDQIQKLVQIANFVKAQEQTVQAEQKEILPGGPAQTETNRRQSVPGNLP